MSSEPLITKSIRLPASLVSALEEGRGTRSFSEYARNLMQSAIDRDALLLALVSAEVDFAREQFTDQVVDLVTLIFSNLPSFTQEDCDRAVAYLKRERD